MHWAVYVGFGGALGSILRNAMGMAATRWFSSAHFYAGTLLVNATGCLLGGLLFGWLHSRTTMPETLRLALQTGLLGGFTTFSTFGVEALRLWRDHSVVGALGYVAASVIIGMGLAALGWWFARQLWGG